MCVCEREREREREEIVDVIPETTFKNKNKRAPKINDTQTHELKLRIHNNCSWFRTVPLTDLTTIIQSEYLLSFTMTSPRLKKDDNCDLTEWIW